MKRQRVIVNDLMQSEYTYLLTEPVGENFNFGFRPELTPEEMLKLGIFGGKYMTDCAAEFPENGLRKLSFAQITMTQT
jgi:hypothetical protein